MAWSSRTATVPGLTDYLRRTRSQGVRLCLLYGWGAILQVHFLEENRIMRARSHRSSPDRSRWLMTLAAFVGATSTRSVGAAEPQKPRPSRTDPAVFRAPWPRPGPRPERIRCRRLVGWDANNVNNEATSPPRLRAPWPRPGPRPERIRCRRLEGRDANNVNNVATSLPPPGPRPERLRFGRFFDSAVSTYVSYGPT